MHLTLLGTGVPTPNPRRRGPSQMVHVGRQSILVDCGSGTVHRMIEAGVPPAAVNHVLITHHHCDHYVDLDHFIITRWITGDGRPLNVYGPPGQRHIVETMLETHAYDLAKRVEHQGGARPLPQVAVHEIDAGEVLNLNGLKVTAFLVEHPPIDVAYGFRFDTRDRSIVLSGDTRPCDNLVRNARGVDVLVHECMHSAKSPFSPGSGWDSAEQRLESMARYHTFPDQLGRVARDCAPGMLVTTHMVAASEPGELRDMISRDFAGPLLIGEDLMTA